MRGGATTPLVESDLLINLLPIGVVLSHERKIATNNDVFTGIFGFGPGELIGKSWEMLFPSISDYREFGDRWLEPLSRSGQHCDERIMLRRDGAPVRVRVRGSCKDRHSPYATMACTLELLEPARPAPMLLSEREREIVAGLQDGLTSKEIARQIGISHRTVETYRARLMVKVGARNAMQLVALLRVNPA